MATLHSTGVHLLSRKSLGTVEVTGIRVRGLTEMHNQNAGHDEDENDAAST